MWREEPMGTQKLKQKLPAHLLTTQSESMGNRDFFMNGSTNASSQKCKNFERWRVEFKVLLITDSAPGHPESVCREDENVEIVFLLPKPTSLFRPLDWGIVWFVKATYVQLVSGHI